MCLRSLDRNPFQNHIGKGFQLVLVVLDKQANLFLGFQTEYVVVKASFESFGLLKE